MDTRAALLAAALKVLEEEGEAQFSTRSVCAIANVTAPTPLLESTLKSMEAELPLAIVSVVALFVDAICSGGPMWVASAAVLLPVFTSPPPETAAEFVTFA